MRTLGKVHDIFGWYLGRYWNQLRMFFIAKVAHMNRRVTLTMSFTLTDELPGCFGGNRV